MHALSPFVSFGEWPVMATPSGQSDHNAAMGDGGGHVSPSAPSPPHGPSATRMPPAAPGDVLMDDTGEWPR